MNVADALNHAKTIFGEESDTPSLDAQVLLTHVLGQSRTWLLAHPEAKLTQDQNSKFNQAISRIQANVPLPYVIGHWEFYGLEFALSPAVLIPRPETELLVEQAISWLALNPNRRKAADIGTGSGCIAVTLAQQISDLDVIATDISEDALQIAEQNAQHHQVDQRIRFLQSDLLPTLDIWGAKSDLICANLPYIPTAILHSLKVFGREPVLALDGGADGLNTIRRLLSKIPQYLQPGGLLLLEIDSSQGIPALTLVQKAFPDARVQLLPDLAGHDRLIRVESSFS